MLKSIIFFLSFPFLSLAEGLSGSLSLTNNYVARGTAQNYSQDPVVMANINYDYKGFYIGLFTANVDFEEDKLGIQKSPTNREISGWIGYRFNLNKINIDTMVGSYNYLGDTFTSLDMIEGKVGLSIPIGKLNISSSLGYTPDYFNILGPSIWTDFTLSYQITPKFTFSAGIGRQEIWNKGGSNVMAYNPRGYSYSTWNIGLTYIINDNWSLDLHYYDTDRRDLGAIYSNNPYGQNLSATLKFNF